MLRHTLNTVI